MTTAYDVHELASKKKRVRITFTRPHAEDLCGVISHVCAAYDLVPNGGGQPNDLVPAAVLFAAVERVGAGDVFVNLAAVERIEVRE